MAMAAFPINTRTLQRLLSKRQKCLSLRDTRPLQQLRWLIRVLPPRSMLPSGSKSFSTSSSSNPRSAIDFSPTFQIMKVSYDKGSIEVSQMRVADLVKSTNIYVRDLVTLDLTARREGISNVRRRNVKRRTIGEIMPRETNIVVSFGNIRAIVGLQHVFLADAHDPTVQHFAKELSATFRDNLDNSEDPKELVFLEHLLKDTMESYHRRLRLYEPIVDSFLDKVADEVYSDTGYHLLVPLKDSLQSFELQVRQSYKCLTDLLENDDLMLSLLLTEQQEARRTGNPVAFSRHEHVELLMGVYARQMSNILMETQYLLGRLQSKQEFVALALAGYRNRMIRINVRLAIFQVALGFGATTAGFFGMNLINGMEQAPNAFAMVVAFSGMGGMLIAAGSLSYLSSRMMKKQAALRLDEIETVSNVLGDIGALDHVIKCYVMDEGKRLDKNEFRLLLSQARQTRTTKKEVDLLFTLLDRVPDGTISPDDFHRDFHLGSRKHS